MRERINCFDECAPSLNWRGSTTRGGCCGSIGLNAGKLTSKDGSMKLRLKILANKPRSVAWPASVRAVRCQVKSCNERDPRPLLPASKRFGGHSVETACVKREEGGGNARSVWPEFPGPHVAYNDGDNGFRRRKAKAIPETPPKSGSGAGTRPREAGIPSNRVSSSRGEYVPAPCTHRPSSQPSGAVLRLGFRVKSRYSSVRWIKS